MYYTNIETQEQLAGLGESIEAVKEFYDFYTAKIAEYRQIYEESQIPVGEGFINILTNWEFFKTIHARGTLLFHKLEYIKFDEANGISDHLSCLKIPDIWYLFMSDIPRLLNTREV